MPPKVFSHGSRTGPAPKLFIIDGRFSASDRLFSEEIGRENFFRLIIVILVTVRTDGSRVTSNRKKFREDEERKKRRARVING